MVIRTPLTGLPPTITLPLIEYVASSATKS